MTCKISAGSCDAATGTALGSASLERTFIYDRKPVAAEIISLKLTTPKGSLIVTGIANIVDAVYK